MELLDETDHVLYLTSEASLLSSKPYCDGMVKKVNYRQMTMKVLSSDSQEEFKSKDFEYVGLIDIITGDPIVGRCSLGEEYYEGPFLHGVRHGPDGYGRNIPLFGRESKYLGFWNKGDPVEGVLVTPRFTYVGQLKNGILNGTGWLGRSDLFVYDGEFENGKFHGVGKAIEPDGITYIGEFRKGMRNGMGMLRRNGDYCYSGQWVDDMKEGEGCELLLSKKEEYVGQFLRDKRHGFGTLTCENKVVYEGKWRGGKDVNDYCWLASFSGGRTYVGPLRQGKPHGHGTMIIITEEGKEVVVGEFFDGEHDGNGLRVNIDGVHNPQDAEGSNVPTEIDIIPPILTMEDAHAHLDHHRSSFCEESFLLKSKYASMHRYPNGDTYLGHLNAEQCREGYGLYTQQRTGATFEGYFKDDLRHGVGILIIPGIMKVCGRFENDQIHGHATLVYDDTSSYNGSFLNGVFHGKGTLCESDGRIYLGSFLNGLRHNHGMQKYTDNSVFIGEFKQNKRHGVGTLLEKEGGRILYNGRWFEDKIDGYGVKFYNENNNKFEGTFLCGQRFDKGTLYTADGYILDGPWARDKPISGEFNITYPNGDHYHGYVKSTQGEIPVPHGSGVLKYGNGDVYEGQFIDGKRHGHGICVYVNYDRWDGAWRNDVIHVEGGGILVLNDGTINKYYQRDNTKTQLQLNS